MRVAITLDFLRRHDHGIDADRPGQIAVDCSRDAMAIELPALDNQQIEVAVGAHGATRRRPKQDDPLRLGSLHDPLDNVRKDCRIGFAHSFFCFGIQWHGRLSMWRVSVYPADVPRS